MGGAAMRLLISSYEAAMPSPNSDKWGCFPLDSDEELGPMSTFDKREKDFENKFAHDAELRFKAEARRDKLVGLWAAELMGLSGDEADAYAKSVVVEDLKEAGDDDVFRKLRADFDAKGVEQSDHQIRRTMDEMLAKAIDEIKNKG